MSLVTVNRQGMSFASQSLRVSEIGVDLLRKLDPAPVMLQVMGDMAVIAMLQENATLGIQNGRAEISAGDSYGREAIAQVGYQVLQAMHLEGTIVAKAFCQGSIDADGITVLEPIEMRCREDLSSRLGLQVVASSIGFTFGSTGNRRVDVRFGVPEDGLPFRVVVETQADVQDVSRAELQSILDEAYNVSVDYLERWTGGSN